MDTHNVLADRSLTLFLLFGLTVNGKDIPPHISGNPCNTPAHSAVENRQP